MNAEASVLIRVGQTGAEAIDAIRQKFTAAGDAAATMQGKIAASTAAAKAKSAAIGGLNNAVEKLNKASTALDAVGIGLGGEDVAMVGQLTAGLSALAASPVTATLLAAGVAAAALRSHLKGIQAEIDKGAAAEESFGRLEVAIARANARGVEFTSEMRKAVLEGKSFDEVFGKIGTETLPKVEKSAKATAEALAMGPKIDPGVLGARFGQQIEAGLARARQILEQKGGLTFEARLELERADQAIEKLKRQIEEATDLDTKVKLQMELENAEATRREIDELAEPREVPLLADTEPARGEISAWRRDEEAKGTLIPIGADVSEARRTVLDLFDELGQQAESLLMFGGTRLRNSINEVTGRGRSFSIGADLGALTEEVNAILGVNRPRSQELADLEASLRQQARDLRGSASPGSGFEIFFGQQSNVVDALADKVGAAVRAAQAEETRQAREDSRRTHEKLDKMVDVGSRTLEVNRELTQGFATGRWAGAIAASVTSAQRLTRGSQGF